MCLSSIYCSATVPRSISVWRHLTFISFNIDIPENYIRAISRHFLFCILSLVFDGRLLLRVMVGSSCLRHAVLYTHVPCKGALAAHFLVSGCCWLWKIELSIRAQALGRCTILTCLHFSHVSSLHVGDLLLIPWAAVCNTCWVKLRYCRWPCLSGISVAPSGRPCTLESSTHIHISSRYAKSNEATCSTFRFITYISVQSVLHNVRRANVYTFHQVDEPQQTVHPHLSSIAKVLTALGPRRRPW